MSLILQFKDVKRDDLITLGERLFLFCNLVNNKIQTPNSFIITNEVLTKFLDETGLNNQIKELIDSTSITKDSLNILSSKIQDLILNSEVPYSIFNDIKTAYDNMIIHNDIFKSASIQTIDFIRVGRSAPYLVIRPFLKNNQSLDCIDNIKGSDTLAAALKSLFAQYFTPDTIYNDNLTNLNLVVQKMTNPDKSILLEVTDNEIKINACFGTSEPLKNNEIEGDLYTLDKNNLQIKEYKINKQEFMLFRDENLLRTVRRNLYMRGEEQKLNYNEIEKIIEICYKLKELVQPNNKLEFVFENNKIFLIDLQQNIEGDKITSEESFESAFNVIEKPNIDFSLNSNQINGKSFYSGKTSGNVKIVLSLDDISKVNNNDIIVCRFVKPEFIGAIEKASAVISDSEISSEIEDLIKVPCIINTNNATQLLSDNEYINVDAYSGIISRSEKIENKEKDSEIPFKFDIKIDENTNVESLLEKIRQVKEYLKK
ncbi:MAG TPA: PEP/pyruvate-binding domain-containing protein [Candidatus Nanoarchaeia archaeon]|nr:PEP/pyruvate-binding domain-containing protein [Candidatus Nanoarchaeia archaeon]